MRFQKKGKLTSRYIGSFEVLRIGTVAYHITLPTSLSGIHNVFHVSMLRKSESDPSHILGYEPIAVREDMTYVEKMIPRSSRASLTFQVNSIGKSLMVTPFS